MTKKIIPFIAIFILLINIFGVTAYADSSALWISYKIELEEGNNVFYMTVPGEADGEHLKFGLYRNQRQGKGAEAVPDFY